MTQPSTSAAGRGVRGQDGGAWGFAACSSRVLPTISGMSLAAALRGEEAGAAASEAKSFALTALSIGAPLSKAAWARARRSVEALGSAAACAQTAQKEGRTTRRDILKGILGGAFSSMSPES